MTPCDKHRANIIRYLDNELSGRKLEQFIAHLRTCADCRGELKHQQELSDLLRRSRPLYAAPSKLRDSVSSVLELHMEAAKQRQSGRRSIRQIAKRFFHASSHLGPRFAVPAATIALVAICLMIVPSTVRQVRAASYVNTAVETHRKCLTGSLPLEIRSSSPELVTTWLSDRLGFAFRLPDSRFDTGANPSYRLVGARLVNYKSGHAALLAYEDPHRDAISLLVADSESAVVAGGDEVRAGNLVFHYRGESGFRVITWSTHGVSYALVSSVTAPAQASCLVCHQNMADHGHFKH